VAFSQPLTADRFEKDGDAEDREVTIRVMNTLPVITFDRDAGTRRVVPMRWGISTICQCKS